MDESYFLEPYDLDQARPERTTMPNTARQLPMSPGQVIETFLSDPAGVMPEVMTSDNRIMTMRNGSLIVSDADMVSSRVMFTNHELYGGSRSRLVLKTVGINSIYEKFAATYCERSDKVAAVFETPIIQNLVGSTLREVIVSHYNQLVNHWGGFSGEDNHDYGMMCARVFMFAKAHMPASTIVSEQIKDAEFNTDNISLLLDDIRVHRAIREVSQ